MPWEELGKTQIKIDPSQNDVQLTGSIGEPFRLSGQAIILSKTFYPNNVDKGKIDGPCIIDRIYFSTDNKDLQLFIEVPDLNNPNEWENIAKIYSIDGIKDCTANNIALYQPGIWDVLEADFDTNESFILQLKNPLFCPQGARVYFYSDSDLVAGEEQESWKSLGALVDLVQADYRSYGQTFELSRPIKITSLGILSAHTNTVKINLWDSGDTSAPISSVEVTGVVGEWVYGDITPITVEANKEYAITFNHRAPEWETDQVRVFSNPTSDNFADLITVSTGKLSTQLDTYPTKPTSNNNHYGVLGFKFTAERGSSLGYQVWARKVK